MTTNESAVRALSDDTLKKIAHELTVMRSCSMQRSIRGNSCNASLSVSRS